jgi:hypothetical protein
MQKVMTVWHTFLKFEVHQTAITICSWLSHPTGRAALPSENISRWFYFSRADKPSEDVKSRLFLKNKKL